LRLKRVIFLFVVLSAVLYLAWQTITAVPESKVGNLAAQLDDANITNREYATAELLDIGEQAVPELLAVVNAVEPRRIEWLRRHVPAELIPAPSCTRAQALHALEVLGPQAERAIPEMLALLDGRSSPQRAANILIAIGAPAVAPVARALAANTNAYIQVQLLRILGEMHTNATPVVSDILLYTTSAESELRSAAAVALGQIHAEPDESIAALQKLLRDEHPDVRAAAAAALGRFGHAAAPVKLELLEATGDVSAPVRLAAARAVLELGDARASEIALRQLAEDADPQNRLEAQNLAEEATSIAGEKSP